MEIASQKQVFQPELTVTGFSPSLNWIFYILLKMLI